jgi:predicted DNA-binding protein YlxM (UPF0122 family)
MPKAHHDAVQLYFTTDIPARELADSIGMSLAVFHNLIMRCKRDPSIPLADNVEFMALLKKSRFEDGLTLRRCAEALNVAGYRCCLDTVKKCLKRLRSD